jgi:hypothetical protein
MARQFLVKVCTALKYNHLIDSFRLEPLFYRTLLFGVISDRRDGFPGCDLDTFANILRTKRKSLNAVRNVMALGLGAEDMSTIIRACPNIENLFMLVSHGALYSSAHPTSPGFATLPLRHLYCHSNRIFNLTSMKPLDLPSFSRITHLELFADPRLGNESEDFWRWSKLAELPELTHLALNSTKHMKACVHFFGDMQVAGRIDYFTSAFGMG